MCPYHGWAFDEEGVLRDVPAADKAEAWPRKKLLDSYAVEEKVCKHKLAEAAMPHLQFPAKAVDLVGEQHISVCVSTILSRI